MNNFFSLEAAAKLANLTEGQMLRLKGRGEKIEQEVISLIKQLACDQYADEEKITEYGLPSQWRGGKSLGDQAALLSDALKTKPDAASKKFFSEEWPRLREMVKSTAWIDGLFISLNPLVNYHANLSKIIIPALAKKFKERGWKFTNYREGQLGDDRLRLNAQTTVAYEEMAKIQKGNFWVIPMSLANGKRHPGKTCSSRRYLELAGQGEFGVGPSEALCSTLTHFNERVQPGKVFRMDFPGAEYDHPDASERWTNVPYLNWHDDGGASFGADHAGGCSPYFASVLGRLPQPELLS